MSTAIDYQVGELLELAGARPRGNRHDCPQCGGLRTVTHSEAAFYCHHCQWKGNKVTLEKELGLYRRLPSAEYREVRQRQERAHDAAQRLYAVVHQRQLELQEELRTLGRLEIAAHEVGPSEASWAVLATVYRERPAIEATLDTLESSTTAGILEMTT